MENSPLISVIVPVYNVAEYLPECLDSIINQTYTNLEIILVDDGSTDECPKICDEYAEKDSRIRVIHKKNGGLSDARNAGLDICTGEWVGFVDGDDTIHKDMYKILYDRAVEHNADISVCNFNYIVSDEIRFRHFNSVIEVIHGKYNIINELYCSLGSISVCIKIYKRNKRNIFFPKGKNFEDAYVFVDILNDDDILVKNDIGLYNYRKRDGSITNQSRYKRAIWDVVDAYEHNYQQIELNYSGCIDAAERRLSYAYYTAMYLLLQTDNYTQHYKKIRYLQKKICNNFWKYLSNEKATARSRISILLAAISPILYKKVRYYLDKRNFL